MHSHMGIPPQHEEGIVTQYVLSYLTAGLCTQTLPAPQSGHAASRKTSPRSQLASPHEGVASAVSPASPSATVASVGPLLSAPPHAGRNRTRHVRAWGFIARS